MTLIQRQLLVFRIRGHHRRLRPVKRGHLPIRVPEALGDHLLHLGQQVRHGKKEALGQVVSGPIGMRPRASQKDPKDQEDQDPTNGRKMTNVRTEDGESINSNQNIGPA